MTPMKKMYPYPWKRFLKDKEDFNLFGYGSLINQYSSQKDIKGSLELVPVTAIGVKRILNYDPDEEVRSRRIYQDPDRDDTYFGAFNIEYTGHGQDRANGVIRRVPKIGFRRFYGQGSRILPGSRRMLPLRPARCPPHRGVHLDRP